MYKCMSFFVCISLQVKVVAIDDKLRVVHEDSIKFDTDLPEFR